MEIAILHVAFDPLNVGATARRFIGAFFFHFFSILSDQLNGFGSFPPSHLIIPRSPANYTRKERTCPFL